MNDNYENERLIKSRTKWVVQNFTYDLNGQKKERSNLYLYLQFREIVQFLVLFTLANAILKVH